MAKRKYRFDITRSRLLDGFMEHSKNKKPASDLQFTSQKAKGIYHLVHTGNYYFKQPDAIFYPQQNITKYPVFARPCPTVPRHGFVDSRLIHNETELASLVKEIEATGEPVQIVAMPFLKSDYSGILTPNGVTFGKGHDGATSGTSARYIPSSASNDTFQNLLSFHGPAIGINQPDIPYGEFVGEFEKERATLVQLRGGPSVAGSSRYIPNDTLVDHVVKAEGNLLAWETLVTTFKSGTVVWHPNGALSSHYAVHCILHSIPVICEDKPPKVGEIIRATSAIVSLENKDYTQLARYLATAISQPVIEIARDYQLRTAIASLHASPLWGNEDHLLQLRAIGAATTFRYAAAACFGELRHFQCHGPEGKMETPIPWESCRTYERNFVFYQIFNHNIRAIVETFPSVVRDYQRKGWVGAFGGKKWEDCASATLSLGLGIQAFLHHKNKKTWLQLMSGWNQTVNAVHNGGGLLSKHVDNYFLDTVATAPFVGFINPYCAKVALGIVAVAPNQKPGKVLPLRSTKPAITLYPFNNNVAGFKKVIVGMERLTGLFEVKVRKLPYDDNCYELTFPNVTTTENHDRAMVRRLYTHKVLNLAVKQTDVKAKYVNGSCVAITIHGVCHKLGR